MKNITRLIALSALAILVGCAQIRDMGNTLANLSNIQFKLNNITGFRLAGVDVSRIASVKDLSVSDALSLTSAFARKQLPVAFTLNVDAKNPNTKSSMSTGAATLDNLEWRLIIDDKPTINGGLAQPVTLPGNGKTTTVPLSVGMDMYSFFADKGYDGIVNLALALGGQKGSTSRVKLDAQPTVSTPIGPITYPNRITIVDASFSG